MKRGAIFDMDGTLFDTAKFYVEAWTETADFFGVERHPTLGLEVSGMNSTQALTVLAKHYPQIDGQKYFDKVVQFVAERAERELELLPGVKEILEYLSGQKVLMAVASGSPRWAVEKNLRQAGIGDYFTALVGGDDILHGKPAPDIFLKAAVQIGLPPKDCYVFEDSFNGIRAAYNAGCVPVMIPNQRKPTEEIQNLCVEVCTSFFEAMNSIKEQKF